MEAELLLIMAMFCIAMYLVVKSQQSKNKD
jgi:flagellar biogenesis protein FliO